MSLSGRSLVVLGILATILAFTAPAQAQLCTFSYLSYIVRDASGTPLDAAAKSFTFRGSADDQAWSAELFNRNTSYSGFATKMPPDVLKALKDTITPLTVGSTGCVFRNGATLSVTMAGKTMDLTFNIVQQGNDSNSYLVDGLPFQEGRFEITLPLVQGQHHFYPAKDWMKK
jgi:hypothetical protein